MEINVENKKGNKEGNRLSVEKRNELSCPIEEVVCEDRPNPR